MSDTNFFAKTNYRNQETKFGIKVNDRRRHMYIIGKSGTGKTTLLENMAIQDIKNGAGLAIIDPHGDFADKMLDFVPAERIKDIIYCDPGDLEYPIAFNVVENVSIEYRHLVASGLMGVFKKIWPDVWSARMEYIMINTVLALLEYPDSTLLSINRMLADKDYRKKVVDHLTDPTIKAFWENEFAKYPDKFREEAIVPVQNKVGQFISSPLIRNIIGQPKSAVDVREVMDKGKILLINLSKGKVGEDASNLLGNLWITKLQLAAMSRVDVPEDKRRDFFLYVDEFQNFATESFANILSEARKYRLDLILAHQYIAQLDEKVSDAVFGNVGTMVTFRIGAPDAEFLEKEFAPEFEINDLVSLGFANIYLKLMIDGFASRPFSAITLPPIQKVEESHREEILKFSRERYGVKRAEVEARIAEWSSSYIPQGGVSSPAKFDSNEPKPEFETVCWMCGKKTAVSFEPDGKRPIYCKDCLKLAQGAKARGVDIPVKRPQNNYGSENKSQIQNTLLKEQKTQLTPSPFPEGRERAARPPKFEERRRGVRDAQPKAAQGDTNKSQSLSLNEAIKQQPTGFSRRQNNLRPKKEVDKQDLKDTLNNILHKSEQEG